MENKKVEMTEALALKILDDQLEMGINRAIRSNGVTVGEFFKFLNKVPTHMNTFLGNQIIRAEVQTDEIVDISDFEENIDRAKLKVQTRQWVGSRLLHKKYGDRLHVENNVTVDIRGSIEEAKARAMIDVKSDVLKPETLLPPNPTNAVAEFDLVPANEQYSEALDRALVNKLTRVNVPPLQPGEDIETWGEKLVATVPEEAKPTAKHRKQKPKKIKFED